mgnify:FL=1|tara:strand:+ start:3097 stop:3363 length:267 start_codon:yes stop_codon:yes gene_type:complete
MEADSVVTYAAIIVSSLVATIGLLWKVVDGHHKKDVANLDATRQELKVLTGVYVDTLKEVSEINGKLAGQRALADEVLRKVEELNNAS